VFQPSGIEVLIEKDCMEMGWHNYIRLNAEMFILDAKIESVGDDFAGNL